MTEAAHDFAEFDRFFEEGGYKDGDEPQAFADWLASKTRKKVVGISEEGAVESRPMPSLFAWWTVYFLTPLFLGLGVIIGLCEWLRLGDAGTNPSGKWIGLGLFLSGVFFYFSGRALRREEGW